MLVEPHGRGLALTSAGTAYYGQIRRSPSTSCGRPPTRSRQASRTLTLVRIPGIANQRLLAALPQLPQKAGWAITKSILQPTLSRPDLVRGEADAEAYMAINGLTPNPTSAPN